MGLEVCPVHLMAVPLAAGVRGQAEIFCLGQQKLGMLEGGNTVCNTLPGEAAGPGGGWFGLFCFVLHLVSIVWKPRGEITMEVSPLDVLGDLCPIAQLIVWCGRGWGLRCHHHLAEMRRFICLGRSPRDR